MDLQSQLEQLRTEVADLRAELRGPEEKRTLSGVRLFAAFFGVQCLSYGMLCWNYRSVAQAWYASIFVSDLACAAITFSLIKHVAGTKSKVAQAGYILGGAVGSVIAVWLTKQVYGV